MQFDSEPSGAEVRTVLLETCDAACQAESARASGRDTSYGTVEPGPPQPGPACVTPCVVQVPRRNPILATFTKPGYQPETIKVDTRLAAEGGAAFAGNAILGGAVGAMVDVGSGAALEHHPNPAKAILRPVAASAKPARRR